MIYSLLVKIIFESDLESDLFNQCKSAVLEKC